MRLIDDDGVAAVRQVAHLVGDERKLLQRRDDDRGRGLQCIGELLRILVDLLDDALLVVKLVDRVLQLPVEDQPVGDDDDGIEDLLILCIVQACQPVRQPGDGVALTAASGMLDKVVVPDALRFRVGFQRCGRRRAGDSGGKSSLPCESSFRRRSSLRLAGA